MGQPNEIQLLAEFCILGLRKVLSTATNAREIFAVFLTGLI